MKLSGWDHIQNFRGTKIHCPDKRHVLNLFALGLLEKRIAGRRVVVESDALEAAESTFEKAIAAAQDHGLRGSRLALARAGLHIAGQRINSRPARRARKAVQAAARQRQLALSLPVAC